MSDARIPQRERPTETGKPYRYTACGLDDVYLVNGYEIHRTPEGEGVSVNDVDGLHVAIGVSLVEGKKFLEPEELRWFRRQLDLTRSELARILGYDAQTVARWEKGENRIAAAADRLVRLLFMEQAETGGRERDLLLELDAMDDSETMRKFEEADGAWRRSAVP